MKKYQKAVAVLDNLKIKDIKVYDFNKTSPFYDYFIIATVNERQANAAANNLKQTFKNEIKNIEGKSSGWVLVDMGDVIVHLFRAEEREFYGLDKMLYGILIKDI
ncbi:MAG: ribosome silencing factor [Acholeplasmataceae bacterium]|jgi:ribosome-associated protein